MLSLNYRNFSYVFALFCHQCNFALPVQVHPGDRQTSPSSTVCPVYFSSSLSSSSSFSSFSSFCHYSGSLTLNFIFAFTSIHSFIASLCSLYIILLIDFPSPVDGFHLALHVTHPACPKFASALMGLSLTCCLLGCIFLPSVPFTSLILFSAFLAHSQDFFSPTIL